MNSNITNIKSLLTSDIHESFFAYRLHSLNRAARFFLNNLNAQLLYAVKTNPEPHILKSLYQLGISSFDVASLEEIISVRTLLPNASVFFMHPVKSRHAIREAYYKYRVRHFAIDSEDELFKILQETNNASDLCLFLRLTVPNTYAELNLSEKFGINLQDAPKLLRTMNEFAQVGVSFHVGSQCMHPDAYRIAIRMTGEIIEQAGVPITYFNVGGGFPSIYPGMIPPAMSEYFDAIHDEFEKIAGDEKMNLLAEPGRALVAESTSVIVRVELRKGQLLYINDGTYGSLFDAGTTLRFIFPVQMLRSKAPHSSDLVPFSFYGPTCDSLDFMKGPFYLPRDIKEGDFIEIGQMGAYGRTMTTGFNGFRPSEQVHLVNDEPLMTMYRDDNISDEPLEVIAA